MEKKIRQSNFELLRIVSMLMVLSLHSWMRPDLTAAVDKLAMFTDLLRESICLPAVNIFILISGYFGIKWDIKKLLSLIFQVFFFVFLVYIVCILSRLTQFSIGGLWHHINCLLLDYWFVTAYLILYLIAPVLNSFIETGGGIKKFLIIFFIIQTYFSIYQRAPFDAGSSTFSFIGIYLLGRYLKMENILEKVRTNHLIITLLFVAIVETLYLYLNIIYMPSSDIARQYDNPLVIIEAVCIFLLFGKLKFTNRFVNHTAVSAFGIYLVHMQTDIKDYYIDYCHSLYYQPYLYHLVILLFLFTAIFVVTIIIDRVRMGIFEFAWNCLPDKIK